MAAIRATNTSPEITVRHALFAAGLRYRLHVSALPGRPDIVLPGRHVVVFVHGCFWHGCSKCIDGLRAVKSNSEYWKEKIRSNRERDKRNRAKLRACGWHVEEIWECDARNRGHLMSLVRRIRRRATQK
jgi:DNA mismatch endonuclease (patch repair protein)